MARVLVIDDDRETRETLEEQLRRAGHGVQTTATATDGVRLARERRPDVVLLDAELPDMSPAGVCRALEAEMSTRGVPVVVMLAIDQIEVVGGTGVADSIAKPFSVRELLARIRGVRRKLSQELGFLVQSVHIRDNLELAPNAYRISLAGVAIADGLVYPDRELAINPGRVYGKPPGIETRDPAFGMEAIWIEPGKREQAQTLGYTVVDVSTVVATHLSNVIQTHAHELLGHEEVQQLLNGLAKTAPRLVEDLVPKTLSLGVVVRVLQGLLAERVPIRNLRAIVEVLAEHAARTQDPSVLQAQVRIALGRQIVQDIVGSGAELPVITLEPDLEQLLQASLQGQNGSNGAIEPGLAERLQARLAESTQRQEASGEATVLMVAPQLRTTLARFTRATVPGLHVLAWNEIPDNRRVRLVAAVGR